MIDQLESTLGATRPLTAGLPQSSANPLAAEMERPWLEQQAEQERERAKRTAAYVAKLDESLLDPETFFKNNPLTLRFGEDPEQAKRDVQITAYLRLKNGGRKAPSADHYDLLRARVAHDEFQGTGAVDKAEFHGELVKQATKRRDTKAKQTMIAAAAMDDAMMPNDQAAGFAVVREKLKASPAYDPSNEADDVELFNLARQDAAQRFEPIKDELNLVWLAAVNKAAIPREALESVPDELWGDFLSGLRLRAQSLPDGERETFLAGMRKDMMRQLEGFGRQGAEEIAATGIGTDAADMLPPGMVLPAGAGSGRRDTTEKARLQAEFNRKRRRAHEVRRIINGEYDPIDYVDGWGWLQKAPGVTVTSLTMAVPYVGPAFMAASMQGAAEESVYLRMRDSGMSETDAGQVSGMIAPAIMLPQMGLEKIGYGAWGRKMPWMNKIIDGIGDRVTNRAARLLVKTGTITGIEGTTEVMQDFTGFAVQDLTSAIAPHVPGVDLGEEFKGAWREFPEIAGSMIFLSLFGAAGGLSREAQAAAWAESTPRQRAALGISAEASARIDEAMAQGPASLTAAVDDAWANRQPDTPEALAAATEEAAAMREEAATVEAAKASGVVPQILGNATDGYTVLDGETKEEVGRAPDREGALRIATAHSAALDERNAEKIAYIAGLLEASDEALEMSGDKDARTSLELGTLYTDAVAAAEDPASIDQFAAQAAIKETINGGTGEVSRVAIGRNVPEARGLVRTFTNRLFQGASVRTVVHETGHGMLRRSWEAGTITRAETLEVVKSVNAAMQGRTLKRGAFAGESLSLLDEAAYDAADAATQDRMLHEAVAEIMEAEVMRTRKREKGDKALPMSKGVVTRGVFSAALVRISPKLAGKFKALVEAVRGVVGLSSARALAMKKGIREGTLNEAGLEKFLDKLTGRDLQAEHNGMVYDEHAAILGQEAFTPTEDAPFSMAPGSAADGFDGEAHKREVEALEQSAPLGKNGKPLAPNGKESNLTLRQWATVRTAAFKNWFGDWQALRVQEQMAAMKPVAVKVPDEWRGKSVDEMRALMAGKLDSMVKAKAIISHPLLGKVKIGRRGANKTQSTSGDPAKMLISADLESLFPQSILGGFRPSDEQGVDGYSKLLIPLDIDGMELVAIFSVRHQTDGQWYYNAVAVAAKEERPGSYASPGALSRPLGQTPITGLKDFIRQPLATVNPESVSKVVDENGEPLLVYHGTTQNFDAFAIKQAAMFSDRPEKAAKYGDVMISGFLNIRNPRRASLNEVEGLPYYFNRSSPRSAAEKLIEKGFDGATHADQWAIFDPTQIKSVDNRGSFDPADARHAYSLAPSSMVDSMSMNAAAKIKDPRVKAAIFTRMLDKLGALKRDRDELGIAFGKGYKRKPIEDPRKTASIRREAGMREALRRVELEDEAHARHGGILHGEDYSKLWSNPTWEAIANPDDRFHGRVMSLTTWKRRNPGKNVGGEYDGSGDVPRVAFGGEMAPDVLAQELYDNGQLPAPTVDALWAALTREAASVGKFKEMMKAAQEDLRKARLQAKEEAKAWEWERLKEEEANYSPRQRLLRALAMLDGILSVLPAEVRGRIGGYTQLAKLASDEARLKFLNDRIAKAETEIDKWIKDDHRKQLAALLEKAKPKKNKPGEARRGKIGVEAHRIFAWATQYYGLDETQVDAERIAIENERQRIADESVPGIVHPDLLELSNRERALDLVGDFETKSPADQAAALAWLRNTYTFGRDEWQAKEAERLAEIARLQRVVIEELAKQKGVTLPSLDVPKFDNRKINGMTAEEAEPILRDHDTRVRNTLAKHKAALRKALEEGGVGSLAARQAKEADEQSKEARTMLEAGTGEFISFVQTLERLLGPGHPLVNRWNAAIGEAQMAKTEAMLEADAAWLKAASEALGNPGKLKVQERLWEMSAVQSVTIEKQIREPGSELEVRLANVGALLDGTLDPADHGMTADDLPALQEALDAHNAVDRKGRADTTEFLKFKTAGVRTSVQVKLTPMQAVTLILTARQARYAKNLEVHGFTQDVVDSAISQVGPEAMAMAEWLADYYRDNYEPLAVVFREMFGVDLPQEENYSPFRAERGGVEKDIGGPQEAGMVEPGGFRANMLKTRAPSHQLAPALVGAVSVFQGHVANSEHWRNFAPLVRELKAVLGGLETRHAIEAVHGRSLVRALDGWLLAFEQNGLKQRKMSDGIDKVIRGMQGNIAILGLAFRVSTILKNYLLPAFGSARRIGILPWLRGLARVASGQVSYGQFRNSRVVKLRERAGFSPELKLATAKMLSARPSNRRNAVIWAMEQIAIADARSTALSAAISWDFHYRENAANGMAAAEAAALADMQMQDDVRRTAQPLELAERSLYELSSSEAGRLLFLFATDARKETAIFVEATRRAWKENGVKGLLTNQEFRTAATAIWLTTGLLNTVISRALMDAMDGGDDDEWFDEKNWSPQSMLASTLLGPAGGIPLLRDLVSGFSQGEMTKPLRGIQAAGNLLEAAWEGDIPDKDRALWIERQINKIMIGAGLFHRGAAEMGAFSNVIDQGARMIDNATDEDGKD